jgi:hypothetical protein
VFHFVCNGWKNQAMCLHEVLHKARKTLEIPREAFGEHTLSQTAVFEWYSHFKAGQVSVEDDKCSRRPSTSKMTENVEKIRKLINENHC